MLLFALLSVIFVAQPIQATFDCVEAAENTMRDDDKILSELKKLSVE